MSTSKLSPEFLAQLRKLAVLWGKTVAERVTAEVGSDRSMDFRDIEQFAVLIASGVTEGTVTTLLDKQAEGLTHQLCPACGTCCPVKRLDRPLTLGSGQIVSVNEPICHCPECRRDFFPPKELAAVGRARVQSPRPGDAR